jgi:DNA-binding NtrC family response regulator
MSLEAPQIALIEDDPIMGESLCQCLELEGYRVAWWRSGEEALTGLHAAAHDLVICDIRLPDISGEDVFRRMADVAESPPFLFMTAFGHIDQAVALIRAGAADYVTKPFEIPALLARAKALMARRAPASAGVLGISAAMRAVEVLLRRIARHPSPVLFAGETGVGKEVCARFLHSISPAAREPFMAVNCAAIPDHLLETEVFGHEKGAFTGANARHLGYAERARQGVLFLDEVGELPLPLQAKLLRLIDDRGFHRVGGEASVPFRARVVCATNRDLAAAVAAGRFREDLFYRINVVTIDLPPLRSRCEDISWLMTTLFDELTERIGGLSSLAEEAALAHARECPRAAQSPGTGGDARHRRLGHAGRPVSGSAAAARRRERRHSAAFERTRRRGAARDRTRAAPDPRPDRRSRQAARGIAHDIVGAHAPLRYRGRYPELTAFRNPNVDLGDVRNPQHPRSGRSAVSCLKRFQMPSVPDLARGVLFLPAFRREAKGGSPWHAATGLWTWVAENF